MVFLITQYENGLNLPRMLSLVAGSNPVGRTNADVAQW